MLVGVLMQPVQVKFYQVETALSATDTANEMLHSPMFRALQSVLHYWFTVYCLSVFILHVNREQSEQSHSSLNEKSSDQLNHKGFGFTE